ncbi:glycosyl hydrolase family, N-terminal domain-containing protein [Jimgerdemannia flammicorona]|uniref:Glycosyl hydrolase family, N-terminal domain-containing protein n=1 Tax=Jimgerdemannia flammicorona TaxID=994334 RepID=A0A433QY33_9FUNG|nr:glycosyl hydrolase family, N-terminal domain-containing protein [Jimgerdemannia flammicorona]
MKPRYYPHVVGAAILFADLLHAQTFSGQAPPPNTANALWYRSPGSDWVTDALPIGNGYQASMVFGGVAADRIQLNEESLWAGGPFEDPLYSGNNDVLANRQKHIDGIAALRNIIAQSEYKSTSANQSGTLWGSYRTLGELYINLTAPTSVINYRRELNMDEGVAHTSWQNPDLSIVTKDYFCSYPDHVCVFSLTTNATKGASFNFSFQTPQTDPVVAISCANNVITFRGQAETGGMQFEAQARVCLFLFQALCHYFS